MTVPGLQQGVVVVTTDWIAGYDIAATVGEVMGVAADRRRLSSLPGR